MNSYEKEFRLYSQIKLDNKILFILKKKQISICISTMSLQSLAL